MQREAKEPADRGLAMCSQTTKDPMLLHASMMADCQARGVDKRDAVTGAKTGMQIDAQRDERGGKERDKARRADQARKLATQIDANVFAVEGCEGALVRLMEQDQDGHHPRKASSRARLRCLEPLARHC